MFSGPRRLYLYCRATLQHRLEAAPEPAILCGVDGRQAFHPEAVIMVVPLPVRGGDHINLWLCCHVVSARAPKCAVLQSLLVWVRKLSGAMRSQDTLL